MYDTNIQNNNNITDYSFINLNSSQTIKKKTYQKNNLSEQRRNKKRYFYPIKTSKNFKYRNKYKDEIIKKKATQQFDTNKTTINKFNKS